MIRIITAGLLALSLAACSATGATVTAKTFDTVCASEPAVYASYVTVAVARGTSPTKLQKAAAAHSIITGVCASPPTNLAQGVAAIASAYATIITARAEAARGGA